jgi:hypothetical protein
LFSFETFVPFIHERSKSVTKLSNVEWLLHFVVQVGAVSLLNELNMKL